jgi:hypothetical protein
MKTLYFDCFAGASGNMILAALAALGVNEKELIRHLEMLDIVDFEIEFTTVDKSGISALHAEVKVPDEHGASSSTPNRKNHKRFAAAGNGKRASNKNFRKSSPKPKRKFTVSKSNESIFTKSAQWMPLLMSSAPAWDLKCSESRNSPVQKFTSAAGSRKWRTARFPFRRPPSPNC